MKRLALTTVFMFVSSSLLAQAPPCKAYFTVIREDGGRFMEVMTEDQKKWFTKEQKKYPGVCYDQGRATYAIVVSPRVGDVTTYDSVTSSIKNQHGIETGTVQTNVPRTSKNVVAVTVAIVPVSTEGLVERILFFDSFDTKWLFGSYSNKALELGLKFLVKETAK